MSGSVTSLMSIEEVDALAHSFESCSIAPGEFGHRKHLTVALSYLTTMDPAAATHAMRDGLKRFLAHHGIEGYNETITLFWLRRLEGFVAKRGSAESRAEVIARCLEQTNDGKLIFEYYSRELLNSETAKREWVEPDLRPMD